MSTKEVFFLHINSIFSCAYICTVITEIEGSGNSTSAQSILTLECSQFAIFCVYNLLTIHLTDVYILLTVALTGVVGGGLVVLLLISLTINLLIYCIYHKRAKSVPQKDDRGDTQAEQLYEELDEKHFPKEGAVAMKSNKAYRNITILTLPKPS